MIFSKAKPKNEYNFRTLVSLIRYEAFRYQQTFSSQMLR